MTLALSLVSEQKPESSLRRERIEKGRLSSGET
jgi:hypothetical protein